MRLTPTSAVAPEPSEPQRRRQWLALGAAIVASFSAGLLAAPTVATNPAPTLESTIQWMFDAGLGQESGTPDDAAVSAAVPDIRVEKVEIFDTRSGSMMAIVADPATGLAAYEITVERSGLDWSVSATRLGVPQGR